MLMLIIQGLWKEIFVIDKNMYSAVFSKISNKSSYYSFYGLPPLQYMSAYLSLWSFEMVTNESLLYQKKDGRAHPSFGILLLVWHWIPPPKIKSEILPKKKKKKKKKKNLNSWCHTKRRPHTSILLRRPHAPILLLVWQRLRPYKGPVRVTLPIS